MTENIHSDSAQIRLYDPQIVALGHVIGQCSRQAKRCCFVFVAMIPSLGCLRGGIPLPPLDTTKTLFLPVSLLSQCVMGGMRIHACAVLLPEV